MESNDNKCEKNQEKQQKLSKCVCMQTHEVWEVFIVGKLVLSAKTSSE